METITLRQAQSRSRRGSPAKAASKRLVAEVFAKVIAKFAGAEEES